MASLGGRDLCSTGMIQRHSQFLDRSMCLRSYYSLSRLSLKVVVEVCGAREQRVSGPRCRLCLTGGVQDHAVEELKPFGMLTSRYRCEESWLSRMVNAVTIATLNVGSSTCPGEVSKPKPKPRLSGLPIAGGRSQKLGTLSSRRGNHHAAVAAILMTTNDDDGHKQE